MASDDVASAVDSVVVVPQIVSLMPPLRAYALSFASLLSGGAFVHTLFAPDLRLPLQEVAAARKQ